MGKLKTLVLLITFLTVGTIYGQQDPQYTQYVYNMNILNPAYAGSKGVPAIGLLARTQWVGLDGAPKTTTLSIDSPVSDAIGLGFSVIHDEIGPAKENNVYADFSYTIFTGEESMLSFGLKAGVTFLDVGFLETLEPDPLNIPINQTSPNFGAGIFFHNSKFYVGLSAPNFLETRHLESGDGYVSTASEKMHYFLTSGYVFEMNKNLLFKPSVLFKATSGAPLSVDLSAAFLIREFLELGVNYRIDDSVSGIVGLQVSRNFKIGYAYDYTTSNFGDYNSGSHEIILLFEFNRKNLKSPRFF